MQLNTKQTLAAAVSALVIAGTGSIANADPGKGHGGDKDHAKSAVHATVQTSSGPHTCINPAGNVRGWCKSHVGASYLTGRITAVNGRTATVVLTNGQTVTLNDQYLLNQGVHLTVGQTVTLRGLWQNDVFVVNTGLYNPYAGPYTSASVSGIVLSVNGNSIQLIRGLSIITVDDTQAAARGAVSGVLTPGRNITVAGNWSGSTFVATSIQ